jgi:toxin YoeB
MDIKFSERFICEYKDWYRSQPNIIEKIDQLITSIKINPFTGVGKPERLKEKINWYSRRITKKDRLIYVVDDSFVRLISCCGHYDDK